MSGQNRWWPSDVQRSVLASSGPGVQMNDSGPGQAGPFQHEHVAVAVGVPPQYDQLETQVIADGIRITWATCPATLAKLPQRVEFDADKLTPDECRAWLGTHNVRDYTFLSDARDKPATLTSPRDEADRPPKGFASLSEFFAATVEVEADRAAPFTEADVERAGRALARDFAFRRTLFSS